MTINDMIIPEQILAKAERLNAQNVSFIQTKDGYDVFRLLFKQPNVRLNGNEISLNAGMPVVLLYKDGTVATADTSRHAYWLE